MHFEGDRTIGLNLWLFLAVKDLREIPAVSSSSKTDQHSGKVHIVL